MTLFTEGRLQAFERMMQVMKKLKQYVDVCIGNEAEPAKKDGEHHAGIQG